MDDDGDVVHLLTIHKAKGLEYPIVILAGGALGGSANGGEPIVDREERRLAIRLKADLPGAPARDLEPRRYTELREREKLMEASEGRRLLYVAATRARDRLVVTCFGRLRNKDGSSAGVLLGPLAPMLPVPAALDAPFEDGGLLVLPPPVSPPADQRDGAPAETDLGASRAEWARGRGLLLDAAGRPAPATSPSGLEHVDEDVRRGGPGAPPGRARALALGSVVHRIMELCDLSDAASLVGVAEAAARELERPDLAGEAAGLAAACWRSAPVRAAARAAAADPERVYREVPMGALTDGVVVSGTADLVYQDGDGWVVVDYKTDRAAEPRELLARYRPQGAAYAVVAEALLGCGSVREVCFVAARAPQPDGSALVVTVPVDDELRTEARREIAAAAAEGRPVHPDELAVDTPVDDAAPAAPV